jgi:hypothetical protein
MAAQLKCEVGSVEDALALLATAEVEPLDDIERCRVLLLRARIAFAEHGSSEAWPLLLEAARRAEVADAAGTIAL